MKSDFLYTDRVQRNLLLFGIIWTLKTDISSCEMMLSPIKIKISVKIAAMQLLQPPVWKYYINE